MACLNTGLGCSSIKLTTEDRQRPEIQAFLYKCVLLACYSLHSVFHFEDIFFMQSIVFNNNWPKLIFGGIWTFDVREAD